MSNPEKTACTPIIVGGWIQSNLHQQKYGLGLRKANTGPNPVSDGTVEE
jgi:hypothetical protein